MAQSRMYRYEVGDTVVYDDQSVWPVVTMEGTVVGFANEELTYLEVDFDEDETRVLTEDEVRR